MSEYGNDFVVLSDEDGVESEFEHMDTLEYEGVTYMAFIPAEMSLQEEAELVILKLDGEGTDEEVLVSVDDEALLQKLFDLFVERIDEDEFYEDTEDTEDDGDDDSSQDH